MTFVRAGPLRLNAIAPNALPDKSRLGQLTREMRPLLPELCAIIGLLALIWFSTGEIIRGEHAHELTAARGTTEAVAKVFSETTARIVAEIDQTLLNVRVTYAEQGQQFDLQRWARGQIRRDQMWVQISMIDANGAIVNSTLSQNAIGINIADRPHFRYQLDPTRDELYVSDPMVGRASGEKTIQFSRKLLDRNGDFGGVVVLSLSCDDLSKFYNTSGTYEGSVSLISDRGVVLASGVEQASLIGTKVPSFDSLPAGDGNPVANAASLDTANGIANYHRLRRYPLTVMVEKTNMQIYQRYWLTARQFVTIGAVASVMVLLLGAFWISQRRQAVRSSHALSVTLDGVTQGIMMIDSRGSLSVYNQRAMDLLHLPGQSPSPAAALASIGRIIANGRPLRTGQMNPATTDCQILESVMDDGKVIEIRTTPLANGEKIQTLTDITEQHRAQSHIRYLAHHDVLTGLPNRALLEERIATALTRAAANGSQVVVMFIDLDSFKGVNDTLGHLVGDLLLKHVATVIATVIGPHDFVARLGGDEFIVVRTEVDDAESAAELANLLIDCISDSVIVQDHELRVSTSIGISVFPRDGIDHHALFKKADIALFRAKAEGRATYRIFEAGMDERLHRRLSLEEDLRHAVESGTLQVHFQPQFESGTSRLAGFEALARWNHPKHGWTSPEIFIAVAEEAGLIIRLGSFVLERACEQAMLWPSDCFVAVNVSAIQLLDAGFLGMLKDVLARTGLPPRRLELELTESVMTDSGRQTVTTLTAVRELGVGLALDDFGTGYSSLSNLLRFHFDKVKIDRTFIQEQHRDAEARAILEAILAMSRHIGLKVTAEGVETEEQLAMLKAQGCPLIQGFLLGRAVPGPETLALFNRRPSTAEARARLIQKLLITTDLTAH